MILIDFRCFTCEIGPSVNVCKPLERLGELMRDADPQLTQQLMNDVALSSLSRELARSPEKREVLCEVIYSFTQEAWEPVSSCFWMHFGP